MNKKIIFAALVFYQTKKKIIIAAGLVLFFILFLFFLNKCSNDLKIKFFDESKGELLNGSVYIDNNLIGETDGLFNVPGEYCDEQHRVKLINDDAELEWEFFPEDCRLDQLVLNFGDSIRLSRKLIFSFLDKNTNKSLSGKLFFDKSYVADIDGSYTIKREDCRMIDEINLAVDDETFVWQYDPGLCNKNEVIEFFS